MFIPFLFLFLKKKPQFLSKIALILTTDKYPATLALKIIKKLNI